MAHFRPRRRWQIAGVVGLVTLVGAGFTVVGAHASETSAFSADFESGSLSDWSKSGGTWSITSDDSKVLSQTKASSENAREFAGDTSWTDYTVSAKVKALSLDDDGFVGLLARASGSTTFYRLALTSDGVELQAVKSGTVTVLASSSKTVSTDTWYTLSITLSGTTISGSIDGTSVGSGTSSVSSAGRIGVQTSYATASFDDVTVSTGSTSTPTTTTSSASATTTSTSTTTSSSSSSSTSVAGDALYVSPKGSDSGSGTKSDPTTLATAITEVDAGGTIYLLDGTYSLDETQTIDVGNDGTSSAMKTITAYPGADPVLDFSAMDADDSNRGLSLNGDYWYLSDFTVQYAGDNGISIGGSHNTVESVELAYNQDTGLQISRVSSSTAKSDWPADNLIISCESHDNSDPDGEDADGFAAKLTVGEGNVFQYDVSHNNIDDGWDLYTKTDTGAISPVTIEDSLSYENGTLTDGTVNDEGDRNGFKLGGSDVEVDHIIERNIAYDNGHHGFTYNSNPGSMTIDDNLSIDNAQRNFAFDEGDSTFTDNTSCRFEVDGQSDKISGTADSSNQFWTGSNGSRCSDYEGDLDWSFSSDGTLVTTIGGETVTF